MTKTLNFPLISWLQSITLAPLERRSRSFLVALIDLYQTYISPRKGYSCAYRILHQGESCSCYVKNSLLETDLMSAISRSRQRFRDCHEAAKILKTSNKTCQDIQPQISVQYGQKPFKQYPRRTFLSYSISGFLVSFCSDEDNQAQCCSSCSQSICNMVFSSSQEEPDLDCDVETEEDCLEEEIEEVEE
ncbi:MAG: membrane protein insertion efficiency factor YidD [Phormidium sp. SL48-SHIP]|nr:MAG: membrane protein insertion efficiency factor YidD [Phormidium sp. SL48-SHIP]